MNDDELSLLADLASELSTFVEMTYTVEEMRAADRGCVALVRRVKSVLETAGRPVPEEIDHLLHRFDTE